jgi:ABC-type glycerol-3-phosphate transport system permease component
MEIRNDLGRGRSSAAARGGLLLLCVMAVAGLYLVGMELSLAFRQYSPFNGLAVSPWIGFAGFQKLFSSPGFGDAVANTVIFGLLFAVFHLLMGTIAGTLALRLPLVAGEALGILLVLPAFLPAEVFAQWAFQAVGTQTLISAQAMRWLVPLLCAIKLLGIPVIVSLALREIHGGHLASLPLKVSGLFALVSLMLGANTFYSLSRLLVNPLVYQTTQTVDVLVFRDLFMQMTSTPLPLLQLLFGWLAAAVLAWPAIRLAREVFAPIHDAQAFTQGEGFGWKPLSAVLGLLGFSVAYFWPVFSTFSSNGAVTAPEMAGGWLPAAPGWLLQAAGGAVVATGLAYAASVAVLQASGRMRRLALALLLFLSVLCAHPTLFSKYILIRQWGLINTLLSIAVSTVFSASAVWAMMALSATDVSASRRAQPGMNLLAVFLVQLAVRWSDGLPALLYLHDASQSPINAYRQMITGGQTLAEGAERVAWELGLHVAGYWMALPALILLLAVFVLLPRRKLLAVMAAWSKH